MTAKQCLEHRWLAEFEHNADSFSFVVQLDESEVEGNTVAALPRTVTTSSPSLPRSRVTSSVDSPSGQRRALFMTATSDDDDVLIDHEPTKKCRCEIDEVKQLASCVSTATVTTSPDVDENVEENVNKENCETETCAAKQLLSCADALSAYKDVSLVLSPPPVCVNVIVA